MFLIPILLALLSPEVPLTRPVLEPADGHGPVIAASADRALAVWLDYRGTGDVYGARLDASGRVLDPSGFRIRPGQPQAAVAPAGGGDFLVALGSSCGSLEVVRVTRDANVTAPKKIFDLGGCGGVRPWIATNGDNFLVLVNGSRGVLIDGDANVVAGPFTIAQMGSISANAVASNGHDYMVVTGASNNVMAIPVSARGEVGAAQVVLPAGGLPSIASDGASYFIAATTQHEISTAVVGSDGKRIGAAQPPLSSLYARYIRAAWNGSEYVTVWGTPTPGVYSSDGDLFAARFDAAGRVASMRPIPLGLRADTSSEEFSLASIAGNLLLVRHQVDFHLLGTVIHGSDLVAQTFGPDFPVVMTPPAEASPTIAGIPGGAVVAWKSTTYRAETLDAMGRPTGHVTDIADSGADSVHVGFDGTNVVVCWRSNGTLYLRRYDPALNPIDAFPLPIAGGSSESQYVHVATLAAGGGVSLVAYTSGYPFAASAALVSSSGSVTTIALPEFPLAAAWNGTEFLCMSTAVWRWYPPNGIYPPSPVDVRAFRVAANGRLLDAAPRTIAHLETSADSLAVAANGGGFLVGWRPYSFGAYPPLFGTFVAADGTADAPRPLSSNNAAEGPFLTPLADEYAIAWLTHPTQTTRMLQWRTSRGDTVESLPEVSSRFSDTGAAIGAIGSRIVLVYPRFDADAANVMRLFVRTVSPVPRRHATSH